jgi:thiamine biosynthesis protein ThiI
MSMRYVVARYHEIVLKRGNRAQFVRQLEQNVVRLLRGTGVREVRRGPSRLIVPLGSETDWPEIRERLRRVFGLTNFLLCQRSERSIDALNDGILAAIGTQRIESFAVRTKRADKTFPVTSPEVSRLVGRAVQDHTGSRVDLDHPEVEIYVELLDRDAFFSLEKINGAGGLPLGSSGTALALLSGGIDSPVAAHRIMQRGCRLEFVHFHAVPLQSRVSQDKARELVEVLNRWQPDTRLHLVPFGAVQQEIVAQVSRPFRVVLYRRMMMRIAEAIAHQIGAAALVTGESLGQVASQTLTNLATIEDACGIPILRPLIGMDKLEITTQAERLGTYPISIQPDEDCCQLFVPRHPSTRLRIDRAHAAEEPLDIPALVAAALAGAQVETFTFPKDSRAQTTDNRTQTTEPIAG